jgi:hypothetical protein
MPPTPLLFSLLAAVLASSAEQLGNDDWFARERAGAILAAFGPLAEPTLRRAARSPDAEVRHRAAELLAQGRVTRLDRLTTAAFAGLARDGFGAWPWLDSLPPDYPGRAGTISRYVLEAQAAGHASTLPDWPAYRAATGRLVHDLLAVGKKEAEVNALLRQMVQGDAAQCRAHPAWRWAGPGPRP